MLELQFRGTPPRRAYPDDAGLDLTAHGEYRLPPRGNANVDLGVRVKAPAGHWLMLTGRSSMTGRGLHLPVGIIDPGYIGPLYGVAINLTDEPVHIHDGERICQLIVMRNATEQVRLVEVEQMPQTQRGARGFGSTGP